MAFREILMEEILHSGCHSVVDTTVRGFVNWIRQPDKVKNNANEKGSEGTRLRLEGEMFWTSSLS